MRIANESSSSPLRPGSALRWSVRSTPTAFRGRTTGLRLRSRRRGRGKTSSSGPPRGRSAEGAATPLVTAVVAASDYATVDRALSGLTRQRTPPLEIIVVLAQRGGALDGVRVLDAPGASTWQAWQIGAREARGEWVLLLTGDDEPGDDLVDVLVCAAAASNADAVTCGLRDSAESTVRRLFPGGAAGGVGVLENVFGSVGLVRRTLLAESQPQHCRWQGPRVAALRIALRSRRDDRVGAGGSCLGPGRSRQARRTDAPEALAVLRAYENRLPHGLAALPALAVAKALRRIRVVEPPIGKRVLQACATTGRSRSSAARPDAPDVSGIARSPAHHAVHPPSTTRFAPVTYEDASETRNTTAPTASPASSIRPSGTRAS